MLKLFRHVGLLAVGGLGIAFAGCAATTPMEVAYLYEFKNSTSTPVRINVGENAENPRGTVHLELPPGSTVRQSIDPVPWDRPPPLVQAAFPGCDWQTVPPVPGRYLSGIEFLKARRVVFTADDRGTLRWESVVLALE
jgi:hypothetical protein